ARVGTGLVEPPLARLASNSWSRSGAVAVRTLTILFGSETGNSTGLARMLSAAAEQHGFTPTLVDMADYKPRRLKDEHDLLIITSTHGEGDPPLSAKPFFEFIESRKAPPL